MHAMSRRYTLEEIKIALEDWENPLNEVRCQIEKNAAEVRASLKPLYDGVEKSMSIPSEAWIRVYR